MDVVDSLAPHLEHTELDPFALPNDIDRLCDEARKHNFRAVCVNPVYVPRARDRLEGCNVKTATVVGFPMGTADTSLKCAETDAVIRAGAQEVDMVAHGAWLHEEASWSRYQDDITEVARVCLPACVGLKVILQTSKIRALPNAEGNRLVAQAGTITMEAIAGAGAHPNQGLAHFLKTSDGVYSKAASDDASCLRAAIDRFETDKGLRGLFEIKVAGGVGTTEVAQKFIADGGPGTVIGASKSLTIIGVKT